MNFICVFPFVASYAEEAFVLDLDFFYKFFLSFVFGFVFVVFCFVFFGGGEGEVSTLLHAMSHFVLIRIHFTILNISTTRIVATTCNVVI